ncbi:MAG: dihydroorotate dehydrogenase electron transfer subunit [Planctomycetes bacterium]|nr:dihydroorotate dehydrogenase electron transfer subunit [Planctomycetota bacterium]
MIARVEENRDLGEGWWLAGFDAPALASRLRAGQFVQVRIGTSEDPLIRRPFSVYDVTPAPGRGARTVWLLYQVVGRGTRWMAAQRPGEQMDLLGPLGKPFPDLAARGADDIFLVGGGIGVAPLYFYCREFGQSGAATRPRVFLGARRASLLIGRAAFESLGVPLHLATDDGSLGYRGNVVECLGSELDSRRGAKAAGIGCGPHGMNVALRNFAVERGLDLWISLENYMPCGFGACFGCVVPSPEGQANRRYRRVCVEGPAFPARELPASF